MNRPLSAGEQLLWLIDQAIPQNFIMAAHLSGIPKNFKSFLRDSLDIIQRRQPALFCKIDTDPFPVFLNENVPQIPIETKERKFNLQWIKECESELLLPMPWSKGPLIRVLLLDGGDQCDLLFSLCHIVFDATAGVKLVKQVLNYCEQLNRGFNPSPVSSLSPLPDILQLLKPEVLKRVEDSKEYFKIAHSLNEIAELKGEVNVFPNQRKTRIIPHYLSPEETKKILIYSRKEKASIHTVLCAAMMQSIAEEIRQIRASNDNESFWMGCMTPVNVRPQLKYPIEEYLGNFISNAVHYQLLHENESLFETARKTKYALQIALENGTDIKGLLEANEILRVNESPMETIMRLKDSFSPIGLTNLGVLDIPIQFGQIKLDLLHFLPSINPVLKNGFGISVSGFLDSISLDFLYAEPHISEKKAIQMAENTMSRLRNPYKFSMTN